MEEQINDIPLNTSTEVISQKQKHSHLVTTIILASTVFIIGALLFYFKSVVVAATVNGMPISRLSIVQQLEKQGGKETLDSMITKKLIENEIESKGVDVPDSVVDQEIKTIEEGLVTQNKTTLKEALIAQNMSEQDLRMQIKMQKQIEKILGDKIIVTEQEVQKFIDDSKTPLPKENEKEMKDQIEQQLREQKIKDEVRQLVTALRTQAKIKYYVTY